MHTRPHVSICVTAYLPIRRSVCVCVRERERSLVLVWHKLRCGGLGRSPKHRVQNIVHATSTTAMYADLAERYEADCDTEVGDVVILGGNAEITKCKDELSNAVFGVISKSPAFLMNAQAGNNDSHPMVALKGRVMVKLQGTGKAGDRVVSAGNGEARVAKPDECTAFNVLGRLIKHKYNEETALTECVIGVK